MKYKMILFDLDGTLWDSAANVADSWNMIIDKWTASKPSLSLCRLTADDIHSVMGKPMSEIREILFGELPEEDKLNIADECMNYEVEYIAEHGGVMFSGVRDTLQKLTDMGYRMAIVSNCQTGYINAFLKSMDMRRFFCDAEEWGNTGLSKGENIRIVMTRNGIDPSDAIYVGDTEGDMTAAHAADLEFVHAAYGFGTASSPEYVIYNFPDLLSLM